MFADSDRLREGLERLQAGDRRGAASLFVRLLQEQPRDEQAWWWLSACVDSDRQKRECLERILALNPKNVVARAALERVNQTQPLPLVLAQSAEASGNFTAALKHYEEALARSSCCAAAWFGKGFAAGMLSTSQHDRIGEFFTCLDNGLQASGITPGAPRPVFLQQVYQIDPSLAETLTGYLLILEEQVKWLSGRCPASIANLYAMERVKLADWAYFISRAPGAEWGRACSRGDLLRVAQEAFLATAERVRRTTRGGRARRDQIDYFRALLLSNLALSGINRDADLLDIIDRIREEMLLAVGP